MGATRDGLVIGRQVHFKLRNDVCVPATVTFVPEFVDEPERIHYQQVDLFIMIPPRYRAVDDVGAHKEMSFVPYDKTLWGDNTWHWPGDHAVYQVLEGEDRGTYFVPKAKSDVPPAAAPETRKHFDFFRSPMPEPESVSAAVYGGEPSPANTTYNHVGVVEDDPLVWKYTIQARIAHVGKLQCGCSFGDEWRDWDWCMHHMLFAHNIDLRNLKADIMANEYDADRSLMVDLKRKFGE